MKKKLMFYMMSRFGYHEIEEFIHDFILYFNSSAMSWTKEEQERAVNDEKLIQKFDRMLNTTCSH